MTNQEKRDMIAYELRALRVLSPRPCFPPHLGAPMNWRYWAGGFLFGMIVALEPDERTCNQIERIIKLEEPIPQWG